VRFPAQRGNEKKRNSRGGGGEIQSEREDLRTNEKGSFSSSLLLASLHSLTRFVFTAFETQDRVENLPSSAFPTESGLYLVLDFSFFLQRGVELEEEVERDIERLTHRRVFALPFCFEKQNSLDPSMKDLHLVSPTSESNFERCWSRPKRGGTRWCCGRRALGRRSRE